MAACNTRSYQLAAEVATEIMLQKLEILLSHPVWVKCLSMQTCAEDIKAKLAMIQEILFTRDGLPITMEWLGWLLHAMSDTEEFIDKFHLREARKRHKALQVVARPVAELVCKYKLWRDLSILANKMEKLRDELSEKFPKDPEGKRKNEPANSSSRARVPWQGKKLARLTNFWDLQAPTIFVCHAAKKKDIMTQLKKEPLTIQGISIWGGQGTGKTFLARWVYGQEKYMDYKGRAWVHVSGGLDKREFLLEILKQVRKIAREMKGMDIGEIRRMLTKKFASGKKFLIVLDDVQPSDETLMYELVTCIHIFSHVHIITTTRDEMIASLMNASEVGPIKLENLDNEGSRRMLAWKLHRVPDAQKLSNEEKGILNMCPRLPLCISLLGGFLSNAGEHERKALAKEGSMMTLLDILQLSCHKLPVHLKPCFIYMALFPVVFPIPTRRLVRLWLAEGLLDSYCYDIERKRTRPPEDVGETFILELANRNVIDVVSWRADGSPKACQMLTSLYDMIRPIAMGAGFVHIHAAIRNPTGKQQQPPAQLLERTNFRWLAEHTSIVTDSHGGSFPDSYLSHVRSFLSFHMKRGILSKDISTFLKSTTSKTAYSLLRVLDLEGVHKPSLQGVLHKLKLLRYLGLRSTVLDSLPGAVADLHYLETLDIKHTNIISLPSSFWKARSLRHLHLNWLHINLNTILKACSNTVMALTKLQTLSGLVVGEVGENLMTGHMDRLTTLKLFLRQSDRSTSGAAGKAVADWISFGLTNLQSLTFGVTKKGAETKEGAQPAEGAEPAEGAKPATSQIGPLPKLSLAEEHDKLLELYLVGQLDKPNWKQLLPVSLRVLTLSGSRVEEDTMSALGDLLSNLRTLRLLANSFQGDSLKFIKDGFPSLMILKIWKLPQLEKVCIQQGAMPHLKELEFRHLDRMSKVEGIDHCKELENVCVTSQSDDILNQLNKQIGGRTNVYKSEGIKRPRFADDDYDNSRDEDEDEHEDASP